MRKVYSARQIYLRKRRLNRFVIVAMQLLILVAFIALWEILTYYKVLDSFILSSPSRIIRLVAQFDKRELARHILISLGECVTGFVIATVVGIAIGVALWWSERLRRILEPYVVVLNSLPKIALGPLIIIWVGAGAKAIITMAVLICIIVTIISALNGFMEVDGTEMLLMRALGANKLQILWHLVLPASIPNMLSILKINVGLAWVGTIMGEYLVSSAGLGYLIIYGGVVFQLDLVMMSTVILCLLAAIMYLAVAMVEKSIAKRR